MTITERPIEFDERAKAGIKPGMNISSTTAFEGKSIAYVVRCESSTHYYATWWVKCGEVLHLVRTERQARKLARELASK